MLYVTLRAFDCDTYENECWFPPEVHKNFEQNKCKFPVICSPFRNLDLPVIFSQLGLLEGFNDAKILGNRCEFVTSVFLEKLLTS